MHVTYINLKILHNTTNTTMVYSTFMAFHGHKSPKETPGDTCSPFKMRLHLPMALSGPPKNPKHLSTPVRVHVTKADDDVRSSFIDPTSSKFTRCAASPMYYSELQYAHKNKGFLLPVHTNLPLFLQHHQDLFVNKMLLSGSFLFCVSIKTDGCVKIY